MNQSQIFILSVVFWPNLAIETYDFWINYDDEQATANTRKSRGVNSYAARKTPDQSRQNADKYR